MDGRGGEYVNVPSGAAVAFTVSGALGRHTVRHMDEAGNIAAAVDFNVDCETSIEGDEYYKSLLNMLHFTMAHGSERDEVFYKGKVYSFLVCWVRDHTHVLKGMKYFVGDLKTAIELYRDSQREDGMIWDNVYPRDRDLSYFQQVFQKGGYIQPFEDKRFEFRRMVVEADVEYLYVEGIYGTWQATGDDGWMESMLDSAVRAMEYCIKDPCRWSEKYKLIKRGFTIDTWDLSYPLCGRAPLVQNIHLTL